MNNCDVFDKFFFTDEALFHLTGYVNKQTMRIWSSENLHEFTVDCRTSACSKIGVSRMRTVASIFFNETVIVARHRNHLLGPFINHVTTNWPMVISNKMIQLRPMKQCNYYENSLTIAP